MYFVGVALHDLCFYHISLLLSSSLCHSLCTHTFSYPLTLTFFFSPSSLILCIILSNNCYHYLLCLKPKFIIYELQTFSQKILYLILIGIFHQQVGCLLCGPSLLWLYISDNNPREIELNSFLQEALIMKDFHHSNVLTLIGICLNLDDMPLVVLPFMTHGDLHTYIRDPNNVRIFSIIF